MSIPFGIDYSATADVWQDEDGTIHGLRRNGHTPKYPPGLTRLADVEPERTTWVWPGRLPAGKLVTLDGDPSLGKSTLALTLAAHLSTGRAWPDGSVCPRGAAIILSAEDGIADTVRPRLDAADGDPNQVFVLDSVPVLGTDKPRAPTLSDVDAIESVITAVSARLLIVDVMMAFLPSGTDAHRDQDVRTVLHKLAAMADRTGCTVLLLRHLNKSSSSSVLYRGGGSIGIIGAARAGFVVAPDPDAEDGDDRRILACTKSNLAAMPPSLGYRLVPAPGTHVAMVEWTGVTDHQAAELLTASTSEERTERDDALAWLNDHLTDSGGTALVADIAAAAKRAGIARTTLHRASVKLRVVKEKDGARGPWTWRHPDDRPRDSTRESGIPAHRTWNPGIPVESRTSGMASGPVGRTEGSEGGGSP